MKCEYCGGLIDGSGACIIETESTGVFSIYHTECYPGVDSMSRAVVCDECFANVNVHLHYLGGRYLALCPLCNKIACDLESL